MDSQLDPISDLPSLEPGVTLLESTDPGPLHSLVTDHVRLERCNAVWIDTGGYAQTEPLVELAPSPRALDRIHVARAVTAYQHYTCCERLLGDDPDGPAVDDVGLIVVPAVDGLYRDEDVDGFDGGDLLVHALARLAAAARRHACPVLISRLQDDDLWAPIERLASKTLECEPTPQGPASSARGSRRWFTRWAMAGFLLSKKSSVAVL